MANKKSAIPVIASIDFPLVTKASTKWCQEALRIASHTLELMRAQMACLEIEDFFESHPNIESVRLSGSWDSDDNGGSSYSLYAYATVKQSSEEGEGEEDNEDEEEEDMDDVCYELTDTLHDWAELLDEVTLTADNGSRTFGRIAMSQPEHDQWRAQVEKIELDEVAIETAETKRDPLRV